MVARNKNVVDFEQLDSAKDNANNKSDDNENVNRMNDENNTSTNDVDDDNDNLHGTMYMWL